MDTKTANIDSLLLEFNNGIRGLFNFLKEVDLDNPAIIFAASKVTNLMKAQEDIMINALTPHLLGEWQTPIVNGAADQIVAKLTAMSADLAKQLGDGVIVVLKMALTTPEFKQMAITKLRKLLHAAIHYRLAIEKSKSAAKKP